LHHALPAGRLRAASCCSLWSCRPGWRGVRLGLLASTDPALQFVQQLVQFPAGGDRLAGGLGGDRLPRATRSAQEDLDIGVVSAELPEPAALLGRRAVAGRV